MKSTILLPLSILILLLVPACKTIEEPKEKVVEFGKTITFDYAAGFDNGTLFDTSFEIAAREAGIYDTNRIYEPVTIVYGEGTFFPGLEQALLGMKEGETKNVRIPPERAYGTKIENSTRVLPKNTIDNYENLKIDDVVTVVAPNDNKINTYVKEIGEENIIVDLNHPFAGHNVQFSIILRSIE